MNIKFKVLVTILTFLGSHRCQLTEIFRHTASGSVFGPSHFTSDDKLYFIENLKIMEVNGSTVQQLAGSPTLPNLTGVFLSCSSDSPNCYLGGSLPRFIPSLKQAPITFKSQIFNMGDILGGDNSAGAISLLDLAEEEILRSPIKEGITNKNCAYLQDKTLLCKSSENKDQFLYHEPATTDITVPLNLKLEGEVFSKYRGDLLVGCGIDYSNSTKGFCHAVNITSGIDYGRWDVDVAVAASLEGEAVRQIIEIYQDQFLVSFMLTSGSLSFHNLRNGELVKEEPFPNKPERIHYNSNNSHLVLKSGNDIIGYRVEGIKLTSQANCKSFDRIKETCTECEGNTFPSPNFSECWDILPDNWFSYTWGAGSSNILIIEFKFNDEEIQEGAKKFVNRLKNENLRVRYKGEWDSQRYFKLEEITSSNDQERLRKRYKISYNRNLPPNNIDVKFIYPGFNDLVSCPSFKLTFVNPKSYVVRSRVPSYWHNPWGIKSQIFMTAVLLNLVVFLTKIYFVFMRCFYVEEDHTQKSFWVLRSIWHLETLNFLGLLAVGFRGVLGDFMQSMSEQGFRYVGLSLHFDLLSSREIDQDIYLGKFSGYDLSIQLLTSMPVEIVLYLVLMILSFAVTHQRLKMAFCSMRNAFGLVQLPRIIVFTVLSIEILIRSDKRNVVTILSVPIGILMVLILLFELFGMSNNDPQFPAKYLIFMERENSLNDTRTEIEKNDEKARLGTKKVLYYVFQLLTARHIMFDMKEQQIIKKKKKTKKSIKGNKNKKNQIKNKEDFIVYYEVGEDKRQLIPVESFKLDENLRLQDDNELSEMLSVLYVINQLFFFAIIPILCVTSVFQQPILTLLVSFRFTICACNAKNMEDVLGFKRYLILVQEAFLLIFVLNFTMLAFDALFPLLGTDTLQFISAWLTRLILLSWLIEIIIIFIRVYTIPISPIEGLISLKKSLSRKAVTKGEEISEVERQKRKAKVTLEEIIAMEEKLDDMKREYSRHEFQEAQYTTTPKRELEYDQDYNDENPQKMKFDDEETQMKDRKDYDGFDKQGRLNLQLSD